MNDNIRVIEGDATPNAFAERGNSPAHAGPAPPVAQFELTQALLANCPCCGRTAYLKTSVPRDASGQLTVPNYKVICAGATVCGIRTAVFDSPDKAAAAWNRRHGLAISKESLTRPLYIFDIDGTITDASARRHLVETDKPDWQAFYDQCGQDTPNSPVIRQLRALWRTNAEIWFFTGRPERTRKITEEWLDQHVAVVPNNNYWNVTMRPDEDYTADDVMKGRWVDSMLTCDRERLVAAFDDRSRVVAMWRSKGITCFQVAEGNF